MKVIEKQKELLKGVLSGNLDAMKKLKNFKPMDEEILQKFGLPLNCGCMYFEENNGYYTTVNGKKLTFNENEYKQIVEAYGNNNNFKSIIIK